MKKIGHRRNLLAYLRKTDIQPLPWFDPSH